MSLIVNFLPILDVLEYTVDDVSTSEQNAERNLDSVQTYNFAFTLHLMKNLLGITNELSLTLQRKDQDILNAMAVVKIAKEQLQLMRDDGWDALLNEVISFCIKCDIEIPNMNDTYVLKGRSRREGLARDNGFSTFDEKKLIHFVKLYPSKFSSVDLMAFDNQLDTYILDVRSSNEFAELKGIAGLAVELVKTKREIVYPLVYLLVKLALTLPVATTIVKRTFSAMNIVKNRLRTLGLAKGIAGEGKVQAVKASKQGVEETKKIGEEIAAMKVEEGIKKIGYALAFRFFV
ncbi:uncharacterized protein [Coffea arabica]|uniref:Uncharacterized protein n=1 Tax=Coffea arabica TaxID=13443 RepID=A0ABM4W307_COFAR